MKKKLVEKMRAPRITKNMKGKVVIARIPADGLLTIDYVDTEKRTVLIRHCVTKKEFANYYPESGLWDNKKITYTSIGFSHDEIYGKNNIRKILKTDDIYGIGMEESNQMTDKRYRAEKSKLEKCAERNKRVPDPTKEEVSFLTKYTSGHSIIYYKRKGRYIDVACSECGHHGRYVVTPETYEEITRSLGFTPFHNMGGEPCPYCGNRTVWKASGKAKTTQTSKDHRNIIAKVDGDIVVRHFEIVKDVFGDEMAAGSAEYITEIARSWFFGNGGYQRDFHKNDLYINKDFWDYKNLSGLTNISVRTGKTMSKNLKECLKGTEFEYSQLDKEIRVDDYIDPVNYFQVYRRYPCIELLEKLGMSNLKNWILQWGLWNSKINGKGKTPQEIFNITKERFNDLRKENGGIELLEIYQSEKKNNIRYTEKQMKFIKKNKIMLDSVNTIVKSTSLDKAINYIEKQAKTNSMNIGICTVLYKDYLKMLKQNGRTFTDIVLFPRNLEERHNRELLLQKNKEREEERMLKNKKNPNIKKDAAGLNRRFRYQNSEYIIRAPKDAGEILDEGLLLNHCVGRMGYIEAMNRRDTVILFLRKKKNVKVPYYTLEIKNNMIVQAFGNSDTKPDWTKVNQFLNQFKKDKLEEKISEEKKVG